MKAVRAHVQNGQIVLDEAIDLAEGARVEVLIPDEGGDLVHEDARELEVALEDSTTQFARGEFEDARAFAQRLLAKS